MIALTYFPSLRNAQGQRVRTSWEKLLGRLVVSREVADKHDAPGFSLATYRADRRALANVEHVFAVGIDLDERVDWDMLLHLFDTTDSFLHTTWSSTEAEPRARVFLRLSRPVTGDEYRRVYTASTEIVEAAGLVVDRAASDPSRFWFLPSTPPGGSFRYSVGRGRPVQVDAALAAYPAPAPLRASAPPPAPAGPIGDVEARAAAYLERCEPAISGSGGSTTTLRVATKLVVGFALDEGTAYRLLCSWNARCEPPWSAADLRRKVSEAAKHGHRHMTEGQLRDQRKAS